MTHATTTGRPSAIVRKVCRFATPQRKEDSVFLKGHSDLIVIAVCGRNRHYLLDLVVYWSDRSEVGFSISQISLC